MGIGASVREHRGLVGPIAIFCGVAVLTAAGPVSAGRSHGSAGTTRLANESLCQQRSGDPRQPAMLGAALCSSPMPTGLLSLQARMSFEQLPAHGPVPDASRAERSSFPPCVELPGHRCEVWAQSYDHAGQQDVTGDGFIHTRIVEASPTGERVYVLATSDTAPGSAIDLDIVTMAFDTATGGLVWATPYRGYVSEPLAVGLSLGVGPDDSVYVTGTRADSYPVPSQCSIVTISYDGATGSERWHRGDSYDGCAVGMSIAASPDGQAVYLSAHIPKGEEGPVPGDDDEPPFEGAALALDANTGELRWTTRLPARAEPYAGAHDVVVSPDGSHVYVLGYEANADLRTTAYFVVSLDASDPERLGEKDWEFWYPHPDTSNPPVGVELTPDGSTVLVAGSARGDDGNLGYLTLALSSLDGKRLWEAEFRGGRFNIPWFWDPIAVSPKGDLVFVTGLSTTPNEAGPDPIGWATVAYDAATGNERWRHRFESLSRQATNTLGAFVGNPLETYENFSALRVNPNGTELYVTGKGSGEFDTVALDMDTGDQLWFARYSQGWSGASGLSITPHGDRVFIAGTWDDLIVSGSHTNIGLLAYDVPGG